MSSLRLSLWGIFLALLQGPLVAQTTLLPFTIDDPKGLWRLAPSERELNQGIRLVGRIAPQNGPARLLVFNYTAPLGVPRTLAEFADLIRGEIIVLPISHLTTNPPTISRPLRRNHQLSDQPTRHAQSQTRQRRPPCSHRSPAKFKHRVRRR